MRPFTNYHSQANYDPVHKGQFYYDFKHGDVAFFVLDTRKYRDDSKSRVEDKGTMLGDKQLRALHSWLGRVGLITSN